MAGEEEKRPEAQGSWNEERPAGPPKRRVPSWVWWGCGGGCLLMTLIATVLVVLATRAIREGKDPEKQWPRLAAVLAFDRRPENIELHFGLGLGADQFHMIERTMGLRATVIQYSASASREYEHVMDPAFELPMGLGRLLEPEEGKLTVQGREVPCLRFAGILPDSGGEHGSGIRVDLTGTRKKPRTLELRRREGAQRIEDAEVEAFLVPFDVWREP